MGEVDIWENILKYQGFLFEEELTNISDINILIYYKKDKISDEKLKAVIYFNRKTENVTTFQLSALTNVKNGWETIDNSKSFKEKNIELFREFKIKSIINIL